MANFTRRSWLAGSAAGSLGLALAGAPLGRAASVNTGDNLPMDPARDQIRRQYFPDLELITHHGKKVRFYQDLIKGKIVFINVMYTRCDGVCPGITANLVKVQKLLGARMGRDIFINSLTIKPEQDSPKDLNEYAKSYHIGPGWAFLTGKPEDMESLRIKLGFTDPDPERDKEKSNHIGNVRYGNEPRMLWAACPGMANADFIAESITWVDWKKGTRAGA